ncbi:HepT-like ribonuclease domain-containing protein [Thermus amyloliquefaciens]|uniref:HepT-like ribonuclease domain-containing protein n=1 Tax=Thermus amyloliquefaciens TaxID=1449080 RepID=UPI00056FDB6B|nr:HepT-like ribonuclease domain-containing protein [Thermus amyloliquefaciens]
MRRPRITDRVRLLHMRDAARRALELGQGKNLASLPPEDTTALAVVRLLEILGEAARGLSQELKERYPDVPWREIADTRNRFVHEYFDVDMEVVGAIVEQDLPHLLFRLEKILEEMDT